MKIKSKIIIAILFSVFNSYGESIDSAAILSFTDFIKIVKQNHPLVKQAALQLKIADANKLLAGGNFDPKFFYEYNTKFQDSKSYYALSNGGLKIPTWFGLELKPGYEQNQGYLLNPENTTPENGVAYAQISLSLLQGLLIDERRATLKQAKIIQELAPVVQLNTCNEILYKSGKAYFEWQLAYANKQVYKNALTLSQERFEAIRKAFTYGDRPAIDTIEALIQLQDRLVLLEQAQLEFTAKSLQLSNFLWTENESPIELNNNTIPESLGSNAVKEKTLQSYEIRMDSLLSVHPALKIYDFKLKQLNIEKKLKQEKLKPILNVNYNPLFSQGSINEGYFNNYKWGIGVGFPLFLKKERAELQLTKIKIENTNYESIYKNTELTNKIKSGSKEYNSYKNQLSIFSQALANYEKLWSSEKRLFDSGESSLFLINTREMSFISAQIKRNELANKKNKAILDMEYLYGLLSSIY